VGGMLDISLIMVILQCDKFGKQYRCLLSQINFKTIFEITVRKEFFWVLSSSLLKSAKNSFLEISNVMSPVTHLKMSATSAASIKQGQKNCVRSSGIITLLARQPSDGLG
jgi:hypothetical protein